MFQSGVGRVPKRRFRRSKDSSRNRRASWAVDFGRSGSRDSLLPPLSSLPAPCLTQGRVLPYLPFTVVHSSGYSCSGGGSSRSEHSDSSRFPDWNCGQGSNSVGAPVRSRSSRTRGWGSCQPLSEPEGRGTSQLGFHCSAESRTELGILVGVDMCRTS